MATTTTETTNRARELSRFIPILHWLPTYQRAWLSADIIAGLTL